MLYSGCPDLIIERYDITEPDERLDAVVIGEVKHSDSEQTFKQGLKESLKYRRFARHDDYLIDTPGVTLTSLLITNGYATSGASPDVTHLNGADLLSQGSEDRLVVDTGSLLRSVT